MPTGSRKVIASGTSLLVINIAPDATSASPIAQVNQVA